MIGFDVNNQRMKNLVQDNIRTLLYPNLSKHEVFNVACGDQISLNKMTEILSIISEKDINPIYSNERLGEIKHSAPSISKIKSILS